MALYLCIVLQRSAVLTVETFDAEHDAAALRLGLEVFERLSTGTRFELWTGGKKVSTYQRESTPVRLRSAHG
jgi:hypothetical protein